MVASNKRSVSPHTVPRLETIQRIAKSGIRSALGRFLGRFGRKQTETGQLNDKHEVSFDTKVGIIDDIPNDFASEKKRRLSYTPRHLSENIPRSKSFANSGVYQTYFDAVQAMNTDKTNDLEKRLSDVYDSISALEPDSKDPSPGAFSASHLGPISRNQSIVEENQLVPIGHQDDKFMDALTGEDAPIVIEHEFAPMYRDAEGNITRPAFINIDPRERYHLIQLKRSVEASEALQRRLKYMVDPNETESRAVGATSVETATQTRDAPHLEATLSIQGRKKRNVSSSATKPMKKRRKANTSGFFSGDFSYNVEKPVSAKSQSLNGYLGSLSKAGIKDNRSKHTTVNSEDYDPPYKKFANDAGGTIEKRVGLDTSFKSGEKINVKLDTDYINKTNKIASILNIDETTKIAPKKPSALPSSGFKFTIDSNEVGTAVKNMTEKEQDTPVVPNGFSKPKESLVKEVPVFKFGDGAPKPATGLFSGGASTEGDKSKPSSGLTFGKQPESKDAGAKNEPRALFKDTSDKPVSKFTFGGSSDLSEPRTKRSRDGESAQTATDKPAFSFTPSGTTTPEASKFTFKPKDPEPSKATTPFGGMGAGLFGSKSATPSETKTPLFGASPLTEAKVTDQKTKEQPSAEQTQNPLISLTAQAKDAAKPTFTFGASGTGDGKTPAPAFTFGGNTQAATSTPTPDTKTQSPAFTFGTQTPSATQPFTFGASSKPFSFGSTSESQTAAVAPGTNATKPFTFGTPAPFAASRTLSPFPGAAPAEAPVTGSGPAFARGFGATAPQTPAGAAAGAGGAAPFSFNFGSREPTPDPASIFGGAGGNDGLAFAAGGSQGYTPPPLSGNPMVRNRKIAQMRLRRR